MKRDYRSQLASARQARSEKKTGRNISHHSSSAMMNGDEPTFLCRYFTSSPLNIKRIYISAYMGKLKGYALSIFVSGLSNLVGQQYHVPLSGTTFKFDQDIFLDPETFVELTLVKDGGDEVKRVVPHWVAVDFLSEVK